MSKQSSQITKTQRTLAIYYLLSNLREVSMQELHSQLCGCNKTFSRDIALLKKAGVQIRYSGRRKAFVLESRILSEPNSSTGKSEKRYLEKLRRLVMVMNDIPYIDCAIWYMQTIPGATKRTMQRDFQFFKSIGYYIEYKRSMDDSYFCSQDDPIHHYYCEVPADAYSLTIFKDEWCDEWCEE